MAVKIILRQDVPNLGQTGEVKQVASGYFRNFLLPRGLAVEASRSQLKSLDAVATLEAGKAAKTKARSSALAEKIREINVRILVKMGEQGRLYGSVTNKDIADALAEQANMVVDRHKIELREPLKSIGAHSVPVKLDHGTEAILTVELVPEAEVAE